ncbi:MarR family winged helix-turn-helix transcriptional regulator [Enterococcus hermanniensis]|uniref:DNA-binding transcriptional repressor MarR n=1 Tax=Enterococcus hermanniensis TaxID=249189 RepID=A0A1L8TLY0_9ENTE|nr:MarR family transcriptional regulator [Enterococcus hermanniensis]OJG45290.1 DNA-binding transcriptional repressor MarR [Enterococcus hermanniensis]
MIDEPLDSGHEYEALLLGNQLCFPLYAASREITKHYKQLLDPLNLTYTQYLVMLVLWETDALSVTELGKKLCLDSGTLTPVLKKLETKKFIQRLRDQADERLLTIRLTNSGQRLKEQAKTIPAQIQEFLPLAEEELLLLQRLSTKLVQSISNN